MRPLIFLTCVMSGLLWLGGPAAPRQAGKCSIRGLWARFARRPRGRAAPTASSNSAWRCTSTTTRTGTFPAAATYDKAGKPLLSWRVAILPFIEEKKLYDEFKQDEPWDSAHNKKLLAKMPKLFADPTGKAKADHTFYQVFVGKGAAFEGKRGIKLTDFTDGTSNTILIVEGGVGRPVDQARRSRLPARQEAPRRRRHLPRRVPRRASPTARCGSCPRRSRRRRLRRTSRATAARRSKDE